MLLVLKTTMLKDMRKEVNIITDLLRKIISRDERNNQ
jgi:hypothetical protein